MTPFLGPEPVCTNIGTGIVFGGRPKSYDVTADLNPGPNTLTLTTGSFEDCDCLSLVVAMVNLPAGAAPTAAPAQSHKRATRTPTPEATDTPAPPTATHLPPTLQPPPTATASGGAGPLIVMPNTGEGAETGAGLPWTPIACLLAVAAAAGGWYGRRRWLR